MQLQRSSLPSLLSLAFLGILCGGNPSAARADVLALDWSHLSAAYQSGAANAGTTQNFVVGTYTVGTVFGDNLGQFIQNTPTVGTYAASTGTNPPTNPLYPNGGLTDGQLALQIGVDLTDSTTQDIKFTINFSQAVYGVTFTIFDVDANPSSYVDQIRNILGTDGVTTVQPTLTGSAANLVYPGSGITSSDPSILNAATGTASAAQNTGNGNVNVAFSSNDPISSVSFLYANNHSLSGGGLANAPTNSGTQIIALGNIYWSTLQGQPVPEPSLLATIGLGLAGMSAVVLRRRRRA